VKEKRRIVLYGNSVILGAIGARLRRCPDFDVTALTPQPGHEQEAPSLKPEAVLFDLEATSGEQLLSLLEAGPDLVLVGVSPGVNLVRVWSRRQLRELSIQGLLDVISHELEAPASGPGGGQHVVRRDLPLH
jgi:hypothetical protein